VIRFFEVPSPFLNMPLIIRLDKYEIMKKKETTDYRLMMQITNKKFPFHQLESSFTCKWIVTTLPALFSVVCLPFLLLFLNRLHIKDAPRLSIEELWNVVLVQGLLLLSILVISAWGMFQKLSRELKIISDRLESLKDHLHEETLLSDEWISIEKQPNPTGRLVRTLTDAMRSLPPQSGRSMDSMTLIHSDDQKIQAEENSNLTMFGSRAKNYS